jgi:hypothetical protein
MRAIVNLWAAGKGSGAREAKGRYHERLRVKLDRKGKPYDPVAEELFNSTNLLLLYDERKRDEENQWNVKARREYGKSAHQIPPRKGLSQSEALKKANHIWNYFSEKEFDKREVDLVNTYKNRKSRNHKRLRRKK